MGYRDELEALRARLAAAEADRDEARSEAERLERLLASRPHSGARTPEIIRSPAAPWRSIPGGEPTSVTLVNESARKLEVFWLSYEGRERSAGTVVPGGRIRAQTYVGHCWRMVDAETGEIVQHAFVVAGDDETVITCRE